MMQADLSRRSVGAARAEHSETARQIVHMSMGAFAVLLRWIAWWQALALACAALAFNLFVLPRIARSLYRQGDRDRVAHGIVFYPLSVLLLILVFPRRPDIAAAAWGILAAGDGVATLAGRALGGRRWPWNREKTLAGSIAFAIAGACAGVGLAWWCRPAVTPPPFIAFVVAAPIAAAAVAALVETIPIRLDDNLSVAAAAGAVLWIGALICARYEPTLDAFSGSGNSYQSYAEVSFSLIAIGTAVAANLAVAAAGYAARSVNLSGAVCGALIGVAIFSALGWQGWTLLLVTFLAATISTRTGRTRKQLLGIAEERGGRRGAGNAIANTGVAAIAAMLAGLDVHPAAARLAFAAALVAGGSDTIASEIGKAFGRRTWSVTSFRRVAPGTSGAMSIEGTAAGLFGAVALAGLASTLGIVPNRALPAIVVGATAGSLLESWLGATFEARGILNNDTLNFINTAVSAGIAICLSAWIV
ncbi:MAG TPA: DUF92 domain-containing protein [Vicinamibacterales bacterium]|nr:DUF92 domain-containing protein [Vicinamibacterales bacterium]